MAVRAECPNVKRPQLEVRKRANTKLVEMAPSELRAIITYVGIECFNTASL